MFLNTLAESFWAALDVPGPQCWLDLVVLDAAGCPCWLNLAALELLDILTALLMFFQLVDAPWLFDLLEKIASCQPLASHALEHSPSIRSWVLAENLE